MSDTEPAAGPAVGLLAMAFASVAGTGFTSTGDDSASMAMPVLTGVALLCYAVNLYVLRLAGHPRAGGAAAAPGSDRVLPLCAQPHLRRLPDHPDRADAAHRLTGHAGVHRDSPRRIGKRLLCALYYEEPVLACKFGAEYQAYRRAVHAWVPRLHPCPRQPVRASRAHATSSGRNPIPVNSRRAP